MHLWDRLILHATTTLNLLRPSKLNPTLSAYAQLHGAFDFNRAPLAPPGCRSLIYKSPQHRASWNAKGLDRWYIRPAFDHYRCHKIYTPSTRAEQTAGTVDFFPQNCAVPFASPLDDATQAADAVAHALQGNQSTSPFSAPGDAQYQAIQRLSEIFSHLVHKKQNTSPSPKSPRVQNYATLPRVKTKTTPARVQAIKNKTLPISFSIPTPKAQPTTNYVTNDYYNSNNNNDPPSPMMNQTQP